MLLVLFFPLIFAINEQDRSNLPGIIFQTDFATYSGFLYANEQKTWQMHYLLFESKSNSSTDPLLVWFSGGPGCSGISEVFQEMGPFYISKNGDKLFENIYGWNRYFNLLIVDSPIGVGFSFDTTNVSFIQASDEMTAEQNYISLKDFFNRVQTKYKNRDFYIAGVSYAGIYVPMLSAKVAEDDSFPAKFKGIAIGDGLLNTKILNNGLVLWSNYHDRFSSKDWETLKSCCQNADVDSCDWNVYLTTDNGYDFVGDNSTCGQLLTPIFQDTPLNYYQGCYDFVDSDTVSVNLDNPATLFNRDSTDSLDGYACFRWSQGSLDKYFNDVKIQNALNVDQIFIKSGRKMLNCNGDLGKLYKLTNPDMTPFFTRIFNKLKDFHVLIYNGDIDTVCNFIGNSKFVEQLAMKTNFTVVEERKKWYHRGVLSGFVQRYRNSEKNILLDFLTVNGAGHLSPIDRPGPIYQMINNFVMNFESNYSNRNGINVKPNFSTLLKDQMSTTTPSNNSPKINFFKFSTILLIFSFLIN